MSAVPDPDVLDPEVLDAGVLDPEVLADLLPLGAVLLELVQSHDATFRSAAAELAAAAARGDAAETGRLAHYLKGSSACLAAARVAALCEQLQAAAAAGRCPQPLQLAELVAEHERSVAALHAVLQDAARS